MTGIFAVANESYSSFGIRLQYQYRTVDRIWVAGALWGYG